MLKHQMSDRDGVTEESVDIDLPSSRFLINERGKTIEY